MAPFPHEQQFPILQFRNPTTVPASTPPSSASPPIPRRWTAGLGEEGGSSRARRRACTRRRRRWYVHEMTHQWDQTFLRTSRKISVKKRHLQKKVKKTRNPAVFIKQNFKKFLAAASQKFQDLSQGLVTLMTMFIIATLIENNNSFYFKSLSPPPPLRLLLPLLKRLGPPLPQPKETEREEKTR